MFRGKYEHTVDSKGRLSIPARYREVLLGKGDERLILTNFIVNATHCLDAYPFDAWLRLEEEVSKRPKFERRMVLFQNYYLGAACECTVDKQGRILIPPVLRQYAELKRDVVFVSAIDRFRIWDKSAFEKVFGEAEQHFIEDPDYFSDLGL